MPLNSRNENGKVVHTIKKRDQQMNNINAVYSSRDKMITFDVTTTIKTLYWRIVMKECSIALTERTQLRPRLYLRMRVWYSFSYESQLCQCLPQLFSFHSNYMAVRLRFGSLYYQSLMMCLQSEIGWMLLSHTYSIQYRIAKGPILW